jgi:hypothetical protein
MTRRVATICLTTVFLIGIGSSSVRAQNTELTTASLKGITAVHVLVEKLSESARALGLTEETIRTDAELKLRLAGVRVVTHEESLKIPGMPYLYVDVALSKSGGASHIAVELHQNATLERNGQFVASVTTWDTSGIGSNLTAQDIRDHTKDLVDEFLNAWLSVNPKK